MHLLLTVWRGRERRNREIMNITMGSAATAVSNMLSARYGLLPRRLVFARLRNFLFGA